MNTATRIKLTGLAAACTVFCVGLPVILASTSFVAISGVAWMWGVGHAALILAVVIIYLRSRRKAVPHANLRHLAGAAHYGCGSADQSVVNEGAPTPADLKRTTVSTGQPTSAI